MVYLKYVFLFLYLFCSQSFAEVTILFDGYSKVLSGSVHIGYVVNRYEFDNKKNQFISTYFIKTNELGGNLTESLKAYATKDMKPLSYQYTTLLGKQTKTVDAKFDKNKILATITDGTKVEKINKVMDKGVFLSTFLAYTMLKSPKGFQVDTQYNYEAVAEEDALITKGVAIIKNQEMYNGNKVYKVINEFKDSKFVSYVNERGEVYATKSPAQSISTELVAQPSEATNNMSIPIPLLKALFGEVPTGQNNELSKLRNAGAPKIAPQATTDTAAGQAPVSPSPTLIPGKQIGIPTNKGLQLKGGSKSNPAPTGTPPQDPENNNQEAKKFQPKTDQ